MTGGTTAVAARGRGRIEPLGDAAVLIVLGEEIEPELNRRVHALAAAVRDLARHVPGYGEPVPAYASLLVPVDPIEPGVDVATERLATVLAALEPDPGETEANDRGTSPANDPIELPTRYGGPDGPDLGEVADLAGLRPDDVIAIHAGSIYRVYFLGFSPGFAYLGGVPDAIAVPRRPTPRERVAAGSVGIAGSQTAVYPSATPGGWRIIGRTDAPLWDPRRDPAALLRPGDRVRFVPSR